MELNRLLSGGPDKITEVDDVLNKMGRRIHTKSIQSAHDRELLTAKIIIN